MISEFKSNGEAELLIRSVVDEYIDNAIIHTQGKSSKGLSKIVSFIILTQPGKDLEEMKDKLILLKASGYPILEVEWQPKFADQMDIAYEIISVSTEIKIYRK